MVAILFAQASELISWGVFYQLSIVTRSTGSLKRLLYMWFQIWAAFNKICISKEILKIYTASIPLRNCSLSKFLFCCMKVNIWYVCLCTFLIVICLAVRAHTCIWLQQLHLSVLCCLYSRRGPRRPPSGWTWFCSSLSLGFRSFCMVVFDYITFFYLF